MANIVIIGAGQGGLSAAIHLRLKGHDVHVIEQREVVGGKAAGISFAGYELDPGPSIIILKRIYEDVFRRANRNPNNYLQFERLDPITRVVFEGSTYDLPADRQACVEFVRSLSDSDAASFDALLAKIDRAIPPINDSIFAHAYDKPWQLLDPKLIQFARHFDIRKSFRRQIDEWFQHPMLRAFFYGFPSYSGQSYNSQAPAGLLIPYYMLTEGVWFPKGGVRAIPKAFERLARELGIEIAFGEQVVRIEQSSEKAKQVATTKRTLDADYVVFNRCRLGSQELLNRRELGRPSYSYFTLHYGVRNVMPEIAHHTLLIPQDFSAGFEDLYERKTFPQNPIVYLNSTTSLDSTAAPRGCTNLFCVVTAPAREPHLSWDQADIVRAKSATLRTMQDAGIADFSDQIDFERIQCATTFEERDGNYRGTLYGIDEPQRLFKMFPLANRDTRLKNVFYCGGSVQPGAGLPMVTLSGMFVADQIGRP